MKMLRLFLSALALAGALFAQSSSEKVVGGPYVIHANNTSATVGWVVQTGEEMQKTTLGLGEKKSPVLVGRKLQLKNLKPGSEVNYQAPIGEQGKGSFKTAPQGPAKFQAVVYGDTRTRHEFHRRVMEAVVKSDPDFVVHTGDLVSNGEDAEQWPVFFDIEKELLRKASFFPVLGNHERNDRRYYDFFGVTIPYYSFDWGAAHFVLLNTDLGNLPGGENERKAYWAAQTKWLTEDLQKSQKAQFLFVVTHHPPFTAVKKRQEARHPVLEWTPLFERHGVTAVWSGHDHNYQHHVVQGVHYIVTGGGGAPLYDVDGPIPGVTQKVEKTEHFVRLIVEPGKARAEAVALDGHLIDSFAFDRKR